MDLDFVRPLKADACPPPDVSVEQSFDGDGPFAEVRLFFFFPSVACLLLYFARVGVVNKGLGRMSHRRFAETLVCSSYIVAIFFFFFFFCLV